MSTSKRAYIAKCSSELSWGRASASPDSTFRQHKCNSGPGLVFHLLELGCILLASTQKPSAMLFSPAHSPRLGSLPLQSCKHACMRPPLCLLSGRPLCGGCIRLSALTTLECLENLAAAPLASSPLLPTCGLP